MNFVSFSFFLFLIATVVLYYLFRPIQKHVLLIASIFFYYSISSLKPYQLCALILGIFAITYLGAMAIERLDGNRKKIALSLCVAMIVAILFITKYAYNMLSLFDAIFNINANFSWLKFASIAGISYYALSAIGYLVDVYWGGVQS